MHAQITQKGISMRCAFQTATRVKFWEIAQSTPELYYLRNKWFSLFMYRCLSFIVQGLFLELACCANTQNGLPRILVGGREALRYTDAVRSQSTLKARVEAGHLLSLPTAKVDWKPTESRSVGKCMLLASVDKSGNRRKQILSWQ